MRVRCHVVSNQRSTILTSRLEGTCRRIADGYGNHVLSIVFPVQSNIIVVFAIFLDHLCSPCSVRTCTGEVGSTQYGTVCRPVLHIGRGIAKPFGHVEPSTCTGSIGSDVSIGFIANDGDCRIACKRIAEQGILSRLKRFLFSADGNFVNSSVEYGKTVGEPTRITAPNDPHTGIVAYSQAFILKSGNAILLYSGKTDTKLQNSFVLLLIVSGTGIDIVPSPAFYMTACGKTLRLTIDIGHLDEKALLHRVEANGYIGINGTFGTFLAQINLLGTQMVALQTETDVPCLLYVVER